MTMPTNPLLVLATLVALRGRWQCLYKLSGKDDGIPVILLHGGPGFNSFYLMPLEALGGSVMNVPEYAAHAKKLVNTLSDSSRRASTCGGAT